MVLAGPNLVGQQARWLDFLGEFDFEIVYRLESRHWNADALSRRSCRTCVFNRGDPSLENLEYRVAEVIRTPVVAETVDTHDTWALAKLSKAQAVDPELAVVYGWRADSEYPPPWSEVIENSDATKAYWAQWDMLELNEGPSIENE